MDSVVQKSDGRIELKVRIGRLVYLVNRNTAFFFGEGSRNLIEVGSPVYESLLGVKKRQYVRLSGRFFPDLNHCVRSVGMNRRDALFMPEFIFRFSEIEAL